jgi:uncharacterized membrane protein HdeD (DUF308 family)
MRNGRIGPSITKNQLTKPMTEATKPTGKSMTLFGVIAIILGMLAMMAPGLTGFSIAMVLGGIVLVAGIVRMIWAFQAGSLGRGLLMFAIGGLTAVAGASLLANPLFAAATLTLMLVIYFIADGIAEMVAGFQLGFGSGGGWFIFGGIISVLLGIMLWRQYPLSGVFAMGILIGIKLFFVGLIMITGGSAVRSAAKA